MPGAQSDVTFDLGILLDESEAADPIESVGVLAGQLASMVNAEDVSFLIADFSGNKLVRFARAANGEVLNLAQQSDFAGEPLSDSPYGRVVRFQRVEVAAEEDRWRLYAPVTNRGDAIGVLEMTLPTAPDDATTSLAASAAKALGYVIVADRRHTDLFERGQRNEPFSLAAEIQRRLLPSAPTLEAREFTLAGWLEPASNVGGDTFDYILDRGALHVSITDAMGHEVAAAQLATVAIGSLRNTRRGRSSLADQAAEANTAILTAFPADQIVTGQLLRIDLDSRNAVIVNAGHPAPYRIRDGRAEALLVMADPPFGVIAGHRYTEQVLDIEPGDRLVLVTDGMLERNARRLDLLQALEARAELHPRELVQELAQAIVSAAGGELCDDAVMMCIDWIGGNGERAGIAGATNDVHSAAVAGPSGRQPS